MNFAKYPLSKYVAVFTLLLTSSVSAAEKDFPAWLEDLRIEAMVAGISDQTANEAVDHIEFLPAVIALDRSQPEFVSPFLDYYQKRVDKQKVQKGRQMLIEHEAMFNQIEAQYGVSKFTLVSLWGMETQYGRSLGKLDILSSLATLAYDGRRTEFFRGQLLDAMRMIDIGHVAPSALRGSWAGAFGNMQFMPTTFMLYAVDGDGDNMIDLVDSLPDAFASAANYLSQVGWRANEPAMLEVQLPDDFDWKNAQLSVRKPVEEWSRLGVRAVRMHVETPIYDASNISAKNTLENKAKSRSVNITTVGYKTEKPAQPVQKTISVSLLSLDTLGQKVKGPVAILLPQGYRGPAFMVFDNFDVIMDWNRSVNYALSVAQLADQLRYDSKIAGGQFAESGALSFQEVLNLQSILNARGFNAGKPDGLPGSMTQEALRQYQLANQLPADGYASRSIYERLTAEQQ